MSLTGDIIVFLLCLAASLGASEVLVRGIDQLSARLRLSGGMVGLLTALGADSPEISSALVALFTGASDVGVGVIFGSNHTHQPNKRVGGLLWQDKDVDDLVGRKEPPDDHSSTAG